MKKLPRVGNWLTILVLILLVAFSYAAYSYYQLSREKMIFNNLSEDLEEIMATIDAEDSTLNPKKISYCRRAGEKFGGGRLSCNVDIKFSPVNYAEKDRLEQSLASIFEKSKDTLVPKFSNKLINLNVDSQAIYSFTDRATNIDCLLSKDINDLPDELGSVVALRISCGEIVQRAIYPIK